MLHDDDPISRAAVVIGVNRTGDLDPLAGAIDGANDVGAWLTAEGYHVTPITDADDKPVTLAAVSAAVHHYVGLDTVEKLVIYFSGHGYLNGNAEIWLLSGAPGNANEAIDMTESAELARTSNIASVIFISDACRSTPQSLGASRVRGGSIFPNRPAGNVDPEIDRFFATRPGDPAVELELEDTEKAYAGLFTEVLRRAHLNPRPDAVRSVVVDGEQMSVVPNRKLKALVPQLFLQEIANRRLNIVQRPQLRLECGEESFVARAFYRRMRGAADGGIAGVSLPGRSLEEAVQLAATIAADHGVGALSSLGFVPAGGEFEALAAEARGQMNADRTASFESETGFQVTESRIVEAIGIGVDAERLSNGARLRVTAPGSKTVRPVRPATLLIAFEEGTGALVAALPGYIGAITVHDGNVANISYTPSIGGARWDDYLAFQTQVEEMRALVATAVRHGLFAVDRAEAREFAEKVRALKGFDPTLGLYSALAYAEVGLREEAHSVLDYMRQDLHADLFDIWLAARAGPSPRPLVPSCPMLSQSWSLLRARRVILPEVLMRTTRRSAVWTTFAAEDMPPLERAAREGDLE